MNTWPLCSFTLTILEGMSKEVLYGCFGIVAKTEFGHLQSGRFSVFQENRRAARANDGMGLLINTELPASGDVKPVGSFLTNPMNEIHREPYERNPMMGTL